MRATAALLITALTTAPMAADSCRRATAVHYAPAFAAPAYGHHGYAYQNLVVVPKAFQVVKALDSYSSVGDEYRQAYFAKLVAEELAKIADLKRQLEQPAAPPLLGPNPNIPPAAPKADAGNNDLRVFKAMLENKCASCHQPGSKRLDLSGDPTKLSYEQRGEIVDRVMAPDSDALFMPKGKPPVSGEELTAAWRFKLAAAPKK